MVARLEWLCVWCLLSNHSTSHAHIMFFLTLQRDLRQYEMCDCNAEGVENPDCGASITIRHVCQDEVHITITSDSNNLNSALSFEEATTYYLISKFLQCETDDD